MNEMNEALICPHGLANRKGCDGVFLTNLALAAHLAHNHFTTWGLITGPVPRIFTCWCGELFTLEPAYALAPNGCLADHLQAEGGAVAHYLAVLFKEGFVQEKEF